MKDRTPLYATISASILLFSAIIIYALGFPKLDDPATHLSAIVLIGLALTVVFMAILAIIFAVVGYKNNDQPLGLPEGSVRALLAFSLMLIFVCMAAYLFSEANGKNCAQCGKVLSQVRESDLTELRNNFTVAAEQSKDAQGKPLFEKMADPKDPTGKALIDDLKHPLYDATYYSKQNKDAQDFAKQIFTTLATVFISVVSFYFGSSVTTSAVKAGSSAALGPDEGKEDSLTTALKDRHNAQMEVDSLTEKLNSQSLSESDRSKTQSRLENAKTALAEKQARVSAAQILSKPQSKS